jgi:hypothetical protein
MLPVAIHRDHGVSGRRVIQSCCERCLVAEVAAQRDMRGSPVRCFDSFQDLFSTVRRAVIYKEHVILEAVTP